MCGNMGGVSSGGNGRINLTGIPQSFLDRVVQNNPDANLNAIAKAWRNRYAESEKALTSVSNLKVGDVIDPRRMEIKDSASIGHADSHAWWNEKKSDGSTKKGAFEGYSHFTIANIEKRKDGIRITAKADIGAQNGGKSRISTLTKVFKRTDKVRKTN